MACKVNVVLPEDSGPYISTTFPLGYPPIPKAISKPKDQEEIAPTSTTAGSPIFITVPFP